MSGLKLASSPTGAGNFFVSPPNGAAVDRTLVLPDRAGNLSMDGPVCRVVRYAQQAVTNNVQTKVQLNIKTFDPDNVFDAVTNSRFQPNVPGYYHFDYQVDAVAGAPILLGIAALYKNGSPLDGSDVLHGSFIYNPNVSGYIEGASTGSDVVYLNGTTDYVELFMRINAASPQVNRARLSAKFLRP